MRFLRILGVAICFAAVLPQSSEAQDSRQFKDAWFWGVKGGALSFNSATTTNGGAPLVGAEWLITRSRGGLYVSFDQAWFTTQGSFPDRAVDSTFVRLKNMRRFTLAGMVFPMQSRDLHPYAGAGLTFNQIAGTSLLTGATNGVQYQANLASIQERKAAFSPIFIAGVQKRLSRFSAFGHGTASPTQQAFFLSNEGGSAFNLSLEFGVRYNVGSSIDRAR